MTPNKPNLPPYYLCGLGILTGFVCPRTATGPEAFTLLLRFLSTHLDRADTGASCTILHNFEASIETPFCDASQEFCGYVYAASGTKRVVLPGVTAVSEVAQNEQYPSLKPTLYAGVSATVPQPFGPLNAMSLLFKTLATSKITKVVVSPVTSKPAVSRALEA